MNYDEFCHKLFNSLFFSEWDFLFKVYGIKEKYFNGIILNEEWYWETTGVGSDFSAFYEQFSVNFEILYFWGS